MSDLDVSELASMQAEIMNGIPKAMSQYAGRSEETAAMWDQLAAEIDAVTAAYPNAQIWIPAESASFPSDYNPAETRTSGPTAPTPATEEGQP